MLPIFQPYDSYHRYILDTLDMTMLKPLEARTRALERIKESFNFLPRIIGGINPIIPFATRYRAERMLFALTVSLHRALLNFQMERMIRRLSLVPCDQRSARCSTRTMIDDRARTLTKSRLSLSSRSYAMTRMSHWKIVAGWSL